MRYKFDYFKPVRIITIFGILILLELGNCHIPTDEAKIIGIRIDSDWNELVAAYGENGNVTVLPNKEVKVRLFGYGFDDARIHSILVTTSPDECDSNYYVDPVISRHYVNPGGDNALDFKFTFPEEKTNYYFCFSMQKANTIEETVHQGKQPMQYVTTTTRPKPPPAEERHHIMPLPLQIVIIILLLVLSGLFSGLNLGLMSLDKTELEIILKVGEKRERAFAEKIYPIRKSGNFLLCTLLFGNVIVNSAISILLDDLVGSGVVALFGASFGIVIFGEIVPQSVCSRYGLAVGAYTVWITRFFMFITSPLSWPISKILDKVLGEEVGNVYNKERLLELIRMSKDCQGDLQDCQEVQIVTGALELAKKRVRDVMTSVRDVFMLSSETILDPLVVSEIVKSGYTRIPVYDSTNRNNIVAVLNVKDLALLDPEDKIPLTTICKFYQRAVKFVMEDTPLNVMLEEFKKGHYHLAIAQRINTEGDGDPVYEVVGLITLEDILEEIIQAEIMDEFDVVRNNRRRPRRRDTLAAAVASKDVTSFFYNPDADIVDMSPQLLLATYQYLSTTFDAFRVDVISDHVLQRLIKQNAIRIRPPDAYEGPKCLYEKGKECDYFMLILEGRATIHVGESEMLFEPGPFHYFGYEVIQKMFVQAPRFSIVQEDNVQIIASIDGMSPKRYTFTPDFTLKVTHDLVYLKITTSSYMKAFRATLVERRGSLTFNPQSLSMSVLNSPADGNCLTSTSTPDGRKGSTDANLPTKSVRFHSGLDARSPNNMSRSSPVIDQSDLTSTGSGDRVSPSVDT